MLDVGQFKDLVIDPTLKDVGLYSAEASDLLLGTALVESNLKYLKQLGGGPALGLFQMEPVTFNDIYYRYLVKANKVHLKAAVHAHMVGRDSEYLVTDPVYQLITNLPFAVLMARIKYLMVPAPIPKTVNGQAAYWKKYYNTEHGAGKVEHYLKNLEGI